MTRNTTMTVRLKGELSDFVANNGTYDNVSEYICDLIRRDKERVESEAFQRLKAELIQDFNASESSYLTLTAAEVIARNKKA